MSPSFNVRLSLTSADDIRRWSNGEVRTHKILTPDKQGFHPYGLFSERIFGPVNESVVPSDPQARPMGHIELPRPVFHPLFRRGRAGRAVACLLDLSTTDLKRLLKGESVVITDPADSTRAPGTLIATEDYYSLADQTGARLKVETQAEAVRWLLRRVDCDAAVQRARELRHQDQGESLRILNEVQQNGLHPEWLVLDAIPVLPVGLRSLRFSPSGQPRIDDLNELYVRVLRRCTRIRSLEKLNAPRALILAAVLSLQRRVAELFRDPGGVIRRRVGLGTQPTRTRAPDDSRSSKDYESIEWRNSVRLPLVPNSALKWFECGLPRSVETLKLFAPLLLARFDQAGVDRTQALQQLDRPDASTWTLLERELPRSAVLVTRYIGRSRSSLLAFQPILTNGFAIQLSPIAAQALPGRAECDEVAAFVLGTRTACSEAFVGMMVDQCRHPANGQVVFTPTREMLLGCKSLTRTPLPDAARLAFGAAAEVMNALERGAIGTQTRIHLRYRGERIETTAGRVLVNSVFPDSLPFLNVEFNAPLMNEQLRAVDRQFGPVRAMRVLDELQTVALAALTRSGLSVSHADLAPPPRKREIVDEARTRIADTKKLLGRGIITQSECDARSVEAWMVAEEQITSEVQARLPPILSPGVVAFESVKRIRGLLGFTRDKQDNRRPEPIVASLTEGVGTSDYWLTSQSARQSQWDELRRRWHANRVTRSLLLAMREVCVTQLDCGTTRGIQKSLPPDRPSKFRMSDLIVGRTSCETVRNSNSNKFIVSLGDFITVSIATQIEDLGLINFRVRSPVTCEAPRGVCQRCYGLEQSTRELPEPEMAVGQLAAFSIGEHADKLRMRTFRFGPNVRRSTPMQPETNAPSWPADFRPLGLESLWELLAAGPTEETGVLAPINATVESVGYVDQELILQLRDEHGIGSRISVPRPQAPAVAQGDFVRAGDRLSDTTRINPQDILRILGEEAAAQYLLDEMQRCFQHQHIEIDDKHFELVIRRMLSCADVVSPGDTHFSVGEIIDRSVLRRENEYAAEPLRAATMSLRLSGIEHINRADGWSRLLSGFTSWNGPALACAALSGAQNPVDCVADRAVLGCE